MVKPRWLTLLVTLGLFITTGSIVGHFASDAICVALEAGGGWECTTGNVTDGRPDSVSPVSADLHSSFDLPQSLSAAPLTSLSLTLAAVAPARLPDSPSPPPPPPKLLT